MDATSRQFDPGHYQMENGGGTTPGLVGKKAALLYRRPSPGLTGGGDVTEAARAARIVLYAQGRDRLG
jgi:hypothetical protein